MSRSNQQRAGRGHGRGEPQPGPGGQRTGGRGRNFAVGPVVRMAINGVIDGFRALPAWAQRDAANTLVTLFPREFASREIHLAASRESHLAGDGKPHGAKSQQKPSAEGPDRKRSVPDAGGTSQVSSGPGRRLRGYDRPAVAGLEFAIRLKNHPEGYSMAQQRLDESLLSGATQAVARGVAAGAPDSVIAEVIASAKISVESYRRLWPSKKTRKEYALRHSPKVSDLPRVMSVDDEYVVYTSHKPVRLNAIDDDGTSDVEDGYAPLALRRVPFHRPDTVEKTVSKETIQDFQSGRPGNYVKLEQKIYVLNGHIAIFWLKGFALTGMTWADADDNSVDVSVVTARTPKRKKRKITSAEAE